MAFAERKQLTINPIPEETSWEVTKLFGPRSTLHLKITIQSGKGHNCITKLSPKYTIKDAVVFQVRMDTGLVCSHPHISAPKNTQSFATYSLFCKFGIVHSSDNIYLADVSLSSLIYNTTKTFYTHDETWRLLIEPTTNFEAMYNITVYLRLIDQILKPFALLYKDSKSTDLRLIAKDGAIEVHSGAVIAYSPVLSKKLCEISQVSSRPYKLILPHVKLSTLKHLRDYIYFTNIPKSPHTSLMDLINFASEYKMNELRQMCIQNLAKIVDAKNFYELTHFAVENDMMEFLFDILELIEDGNIKTEDIRKYIHTENVGNK